jgi:type IV pilus assembly protein PilV
MFLIEALVAILIFSLGILGLVAMGATAVSSQSDAQYRTEASSLADSIAGEIALGINRTGSPAVKAASLAAFAHQPTPGACVFGGPATAAPGVAALLARAAAVMPGATNVNQQIIVDTANFNRVEITLCWKTASDGFWRRHTLVTYVN